MDILYEQLNLDSFWTLWFWIAHVITWSLAAHFTMGVPFDMILEANREKVEDGPWTRSTEAIISAQIFRYSEIFTKYGIVLTAASMFLLSIVVTLGTYGNLEIARAIATLLVPLTLIYAITIRLALRLRAAPLSGQALRDRIRRQRLYNQLFGLLGVSMAVAVAVWEGVRYYSPI